MEGRIAKRRVEQEVKARELRPGRARRLADLVDDVLEHALLGHAVDELQGRVLKLIFDDAPRGRRDRAPVTEPPAPRPDSLRHSPILEPTSRAPTGRHSGGRCAPAATAAPARRCPPPACPGCETAARTGPPADTPSALRAA